MKILLLICLCAVSVFAGKPASLCKSDFCSNSTCRCSTADPPASGRLPQLISLTFNEAIVQKYFDKVWIPLLKDRKNADGSNASATFFVPHKYTDYSLVAELYSLGYEIGVHSITKDHRQTYWREETLDTLVNEFSGQRDIISKFARIPNKQIKGVRSPQLQFNANTTFEAYVKSGLIYDNSWPTPPSQRLFPYTLDYMSTELCTATAECPNEPFPGFWVNPIIDIIGKDDKYCHEIYGCEISGTANEIADWLMEQVDASYNDKKAPVTLLADASWFDDVEHSLEGMKIFLDRLNKKQDVFLVSQSDIVEWMQNPVTADKFKPSSKPRRNICTKPQTCTYKTDDGENPKMVSCVACPKNYPWLGNPEGN